MRTDKALQQRCSTWYLYFYLSTFWEYLYMYLVVLVTSLPCRMYVYWRMHCFLYSCYTSHKRFFFCYLGQPGVTLENLVKQKLKVKVIEVVSMAEYQLTAFLCVLYVALSSSVSTTATRNCSSCLSLWHWDQNRTSTSVKVLRLVPGWSNVWAHWTSTSVKLLRLVPGWSYDWTVWTSEDLVYWADVLVTASRNTLALSIVASLKLICLSDISTEACCWCLCCIVKRMIRGKW